MNVKFKKLSQLAKIPSRAYPGDAGLDLISTNKECVWYYKLHEPETKKQHIIYGTGIALEIPEGFVGLIFPRSSIHKHDLMLSNSVAVIDSGYRGEIKLIFNVRNDKNYNFEYNVGDKIGQLVILPLPQIELEEADTLSETNRNKKSFGSSGA